LRRPPPLIRPPIHHFRPLPERFVLAVFATRSSAEIFAASLRLVRIPNQVVNFFHSRFFGHPVAVRIHARDQHIAGRLMCAQCQADFLGWFDD
jgi:hypothetical protein